MNTRPASLMRDLVLPTLLFMALGGMTWAVRGCSGYGAMNGCIFAGVTWGIAWWFIAREPRGEQTRRYTSGWIILALAFGIGISGMRGWMQWPSFFEGHLQTNSPKGEFVPIPRIYGFVWQFISGIPWAGIGACMLAWCGSAKRLSRAEWGVRIACGVAGGVAAHFIFVAFPDVFLPLYGAMKSRYEDLAANPNLRRLIGDNRLAIEHLGVYLGFLSYEVFRRDWKNVVLIVTVGLLNGIGWSLLQNWSWAHGLWPNVAMNWWRCWESSGGLSIGFAYGIAYFLVNREVSDAECARCRDVLVNLRPNLERFGAYFGIVYGMGYSIKCGLKGWANIYLGNEDHWDKVFSGIAFPSMLLLSFGLAVWTRTRRLPSGFEGDVFPHANKLLWFVIITQNILAQMVTGPTSEWTEVAFKLYYVFLFLLSGVILYHYQSIKRDEAA